MDSIFELMLLFCKMLINLLFSSRTCGGLVWQSNFRARILDDDPALQRPEHLPLKQYLEEDKKEAKVWSRIS
ncbi:MAG TPA: hypothetical protein PKC76_12945 [Saprospiraceae bacterium]|nr:hypothetical protein [Saprospiraceae bacterium]HMP25038.1 hypothetical protein [Saprospiraceae bacterium]